jgi:hypothetical protein
MAEINQEVAENRPNKPAGAQQAAQACDEAADPATEYMAVRGGFFVVVTRGAEAYWLVTHDCVR